MTGKRKSLEGTSDAKDEPTIESLPDNVLFRIIEKAKAGCESPLLINYIASVNKRFRSFTPRASPLPFAVNTAAEEVMRKETSLDETTDPLALSRLTITSGSVSKMEVMDG